MLFHNAQGKFFINQGLAIAFNRCDSHPLSCQVLLDLDKWIEWEIILVQVAYWPDIVDV